MSGCEVVVIAGADPEPLTIIERAESSFAISEQVTEIVDIQLIRGPSGDSWVPLSYHQETPSMQWVINHNLGYFPTVNVFDDEGNAIDCNVIMVSVNQMKLIFAVPITGTARLI